MLNNVLLKNYTEDTLIHNYPLQISHYWKKYYIPSSKVNLYL